jgi:heavy metal translocating P-type ATPase
VTAKPSKRHGAFGADAILLGIAVIALAVGGIARFADADAAARLAWAAGTIVVFGRLAFEIVAKLLRRAAGVDIVAALSMAAALALGQYLVGIVIALMYAGGTALEDYAEGRARRELTALLSRRPRTAHRERDGRLDEIAIEAIAVRDVLLIRTGEVLPVDGVLADGGASIDQSALTGESRLAEFRAGDRVRSGAVNAGPPFRLRALDTADESTFAGIIRLVEQAQKEKAPFVRMADRFAVGLVPVTLALAAAAWAITGDPLRALAVLVVATPCPLIIAAPVAMVAGISAAARRGILIKGGGALEALARAATLMLDKTGTITTGVARVTAVETGGDFDADEVVRLAASLDQVSLHAMSEAVTDEARRRDVVLAMPDAVRESPGAGIEGRVGDRRVRVGTLAYALDGAAATPWADRIARRAAEEGLATVFVAVDGAVAGALVLVDEIRLDTPRALRALRAAGFGRIVMVSGDRYDVAEGIAMALGIDTVRAECLPEDKIEAVRDERARAPTAMVGDGINDAPALAAADVGIAMGLRGGGAASEAADVVLLADRLDRLAEAVWLARRSRRIAVESVVVGMGLSGAAMIGAAFGLLTPVVGALLQEVVDVIVILNALRAARGAAFRTEGAAASLGDLAALRAEHDALGGILDRIRQIADRLDDPDYRDLQPDLVALDARIRDEILPHERSDEAVLHPRLGSALGGHDAMAATSRTHREIVHFARRLHGLIARVPPGGPNREDLSDLRRTMYGLEAIIRLHFAQEEELYDSIGREAARTS